MKLYWLGIPAFLAIFLLGFSTEAKLKQKSIRYKHGSQILEGYLVYDDSLNTKRPAVLIAHDWMGLSDKTKERANQIAEQGYIAFAIDMYGKGVRPKDTQAAAQISKTYKQNRSLMRARALSGLDYLRSHQLADTTRIAAIGYCFGGSVVLELARAGANLNGIISFHGNLSTPRPEDTRNIKSKVLVFHGSDDPIVSSAELEAFKKEMRDARTDWQLVEFGNTVHSFTDRSAGSDISKGSAYNEKADRRSWKFLQQFFSEIF